MEPHVRQPRRGREQHGRLRVQRCAWSNPVLKKLKVVEYGLAVGNTDAARVISVYETKNHRMVQERERHRQPLEQ